MLAEDSNRIVHAIDRVTTTISGTGLTLSENLAQVNGATVNVGTGAAGTGTQRVTTSTDSSTMIVSSGSQTITSSTVTDNTLSPVAAGTTDVGFTTSSTFVGTINGIARSASTFYDFQSAVGKTNPAIPYTVTAGSMIIDKYT